LHEARIQNFMTGKTATIIGSTGLVGSYLLQQLKEENTYSIIRLLVRRPIENTHPKVEVKLIDFNDTESFKLGIDGSDVVFCAIGTTQAKVKGDKNAYRKVDYDIPVKAAQFCKETGCEQFVLVSSAGADSKSNNFYLRLKGEVEDTVKAIGLKQFLVFRPSILLGDRQEKRPGERFGQAFMQTFSFMLIGKWNKYKPIHAKDVATAMINAARQNVSGFRVYELAEMKNVIK